MLLRVLLYTPRIQIHYFKVNTTCSFFIFFISLNALFVSEIFRDCFMFLISYVFAIIYTDCIGSAFNVKGAMQCPNCRKIEKGQWLYANGSRPLPEFSMDDWAHDEDLYDLSYSEMVIL